jgi:naphtho-gamma-pyrone polyketide synthase
MQSLWADVALTLGDYLFKDYLSKEPKKITADCGMAVSDMVVEKPLIATGKGPQLFRASASADWKFMQADVHIFSVTPEGKKIADHAKCVLRYENSKDWLGSWKRTDYLIRSRIKLLQQSVDDVQVHKIKRGLTYKLFSSFVEYGPCFQGMQETLFDSSQLEATALVKFQTTEKDGSFHFSPYWIDSLGHICGFIMNGTECIDWKNMVYVNHGWDNMRCATTFSPEKSYRTYVRMINIGGTMHSGDVYIFDEDTVVGVYEGVKVRLVPSLPCVSSTNLQQFQGIPRQVIDQLLPSPSGRKAAPVSKPTAGAVSRPQAGRAKSLPAPESVQALPKPSGAPSKQTNMMSRVLEIVAEEIGLAISELSPSSQFADLGVDSLMSLTITGRLREELDLDVPSSLFADYETVKELSEFLGGGQDSTPSTSTDSSTNPTPMTDSLPDTSDYMTDDTEVDFEDTAAMSIISRILGEEIGVSVDELAKCHDFGELGLDSLMSLTILGRLREELDMDLPSGLFADNNSLSQVAAALGLTGRDSISPLESTTAKPTPKAAIPKATSILLQGSPKTASKTLFLFPDGSGAATSYAPLPRISPDVAVYGLNCPYQKSPEEFHSSLDELTAPYLEEIRRRQPHGPYYFGGWSAGGISAFDAAQELERSGETVARLILIDSPFPIGLEKLPPRLYDFFSSIGMFGAGEGKAPPKWLIPHFLAFVDSLDKYRAKPFAAGRGPKTHIVWARDGVCKNPGDPRPEPRADDPREMKWLLENRTDFGPNGWDALLGRDDVVIETLDNANHFSMMEGEKVVELARFLERAMA